MSLPRSLWRKTLVPKPNETTDEGTILHLQRPSTKLYTQNVLFCAYAIVHTKKHFSSHPPEGQIPMRREKFCLSPGKLLLTIYKYTQYITQNKSVTSLHLASIVRQISNSCISACISKIINYTQTGTLCILLNK